MSSRQLRKLQQQRELEKAKLRAEEEEESEEDPVAKLQSKPSLFAALGNQDDDDDEDDEDENVLDKPKEEVKLESSIAAPPKSKKSKKKKKKGKSKPKEEVAEISNEVDEIDAAIQELNVKKSAEGPEATPVNPEYKRICALLGINAQHLKVANEMRNLFGRTAIEVRDDPGVPTGRAARRQRGQNQQVDLETVLKGRHLPGKGLPEITLRRNTFIQGKEDWPKAPTGGLAMLLVDDQRTCDGTVEFRYDHNDEYQGTQQAFHGYVEMGDPQNLIGLLQQNPYHISLLIQVSKVAKDQGDHALSADLLERALFTFGRVATTLFTTQLTAGKARLDFARPENRELWLAGYQYIKSLVMKGTYRTALEWAKLLLSIDPEGDPYCMRLMIHHLALRAGEFNWLLDFYESKIPSIQDASRLKGATTETSHFTPSLAFAAMSLKEGTQCRKFLTESMQKVPWLFARMFKELDLDVPPSIWGIEPRTDAESLFTELYIKQTKDLWNTPAATALLMEIAHTISKVDLARLPKLRNAEMTLDVVRFVYLDNTPALMSLAPSRLLHRSNNSDSDPLPPDKNIFSYEHQGKVLAMNARTGMGGDFLDPLAALARLLPSLRRTNDDREDPTEEEREMRREIEEAVASGEAGMREEGPPASLARRLLSIIWPGAERDSWEDDSIGVDDSDDASTDTENEMPDLIEQEEDTDDEMPDLILANER
ncbi:transcriptional repressor TCF25-domain-containing protein [Amylocarpus encephaloides]|uniref:Transcriptional repressor TCF25-domain-containing protein n=1 Tax=Amylocarpus encephaloides TaxID=45428 RepID=A0A9P7Y8M3_9HELO|nr:transcriptional repressor TCF25-domain-containing protein [Amylocarpus encephaloides]